MDFFYRERAWYAGQFVRCITPKVTLSRRCAAFLTTLLNKQKPILLSVLVRDVDTTFQNLQVKLPVTEDRAPDFALMERVIAELEAYLEACGLQDTRLSLQEEQALAIFSKTSFQAFDIPQIFTVRNTHSILAQEILGAGTVPYLCASAENNAVSAYVTHHKELLEPGNTRFIGGQTFVVTYQAEDYFSNDSHNLALTLKAKAYRDELTQLYLATCLRKSLSHQYSWGSSVSHTKILRDKIILPVTAEGEPDYAAMATLISAVEKRVIDRLSAWRKREREATAQCITS